MQDSSTPIPLQDVVLHQLTIDERQNGDRYGFTYLLQSPNLDILQRYESDNLHSDKIGYLNSIYESIENFIVNYSEDEDEYEAR